MAFGLIVLVSYAWRVLNWVWWRPKRLERLLRQQGLKGNPYRLFFGDTKDMAIMSNEATLRPLNLTDDIRPRVFPFYHQIITEYGKNSFIWKGPIPRVNIMDPELINQILTKNNIFKKPEVSPILKQLFDGLAQIEDEKWAKHRKIMNPAFHVEKLKHLLPAMHLCCNEVMSKWEALVSEKGSCDVDVLPYLNNLTCDVISRTAFGSSYEQGRRIFELQKEQAIIVSRALLLDYIPGWSFVPTKKNKRMKEINNELQILLKGIINRRSERAMKIGEIVNDNDDLLGILVKSNQNKIQEHGGNKKDAGMSIDDIAEECKLFYFAGQETTANLLAWTMVLLSMHPKWQVRAREEVWQVFGKNKPDYDGLSHLKCVTMILNEVLRLYPPAAILVRVINDDTRIGELNLPAGVHFMIPTVLIHRDCEIWGEDAKEFNPERFSKGIAKATKNQGSFFPFGLGPRICIGNNFAMMEAKTALAMILQRFSFELSPSYTHAPFFVLTLQPQNGVHLILHKL
ncbi:cytochrome P450 CYP72A219-like [Actinidia eriantha]|uniref:cytochrome P450 CYP72A219-like n=1 Tax=Actinidia eriantha TaxID=165200 RepID=UPI0025877E09|nr:cytochrome P450 CYP72A219-like [Actinidia eriantha]